MPKITKGGVSDRRIDPNYMAPSGTPVEKALDLGLPDAGKSDNAPDKNDDNNPESAGQDAKDSDKPPAKRRSSRS